MEICTNELHHQYSICLIELVSVDMFSPGNLPALHTNNQQEIEQNIIFRHFHTHLAISIGIVTMSSPALIYAISLTTALN